jgi:hypothetical protein
MFIVCRRRNSKIGAMAFTETGKIAGVSQAKKCMRPAKYTCPSIDIRSLPSHAVRHLVSQQRHDSDKQDKESGPMRLEPVKELNDVRTKSTLIISNQFIPSMNFLDYGWQVLCCNHWTAGINDITNKVRH